MTVTNPRMTALTPTTKRGSASPKECHMDIIGAIVSRPQRRSRRRSSSPRAFVPVERIISCTNCGMAPMDRSLAVRKLVELSAGAALARSLARSMTRNRTSLPFKRPSVERDLRAGAFDRAEPHQRKGGRYTLNSMAPLATDRKQPTIALVC
jgi:hypothetical protein